MQEKKDLKVFGTFLYSNTFLRVEYKNLDLEGFFEITEIVIL